MSQCPVCLQPIPYNERRLIGSQVLHSRCLVCADCQKSIGDGSFEELEENALCIVCYNHRTDSSSASSTTTTTTTAVSDNLSITTEEVLTNDEDPYLNLSARYGSMKTFLERVHLYNEYNQKKTSHLNVTERDGKIRISGLLRIYWHINTPIKLKSGQSIPLGLYPKSLGIYEMNDEKSNNDISSDQQLSKNIELLAKRACYDDTVLSKLSLTDENDPSQAANLRRVQTIRVPSSQRRTYRVTLPTFMQSPNPATEDDDETRCFIPAKDSMTTVYINSETTVSETVSLLFSKHFIDDANCPAFTLYKVERCNGNSIEMSDDDYPLVLRILAGPFENDIFFYLMEHGKAKSVPLEVSNYLVLPEMMLRAFIEKFSYEEVEQIHAIKRKYLAYKQSLLSQFEMAIAQS